MAGGVDAADARQAVEPFQQLHAGLAADKPMIGLLADLARPPRDFAFSGHKKYFFTFIYL